MNIIGHTIDTATSLLQPHTVPELDPSNMGAALLLLFAAILVLRRPARR